MKTKKIFSADNYFNTKLIIVVNAIILFTLLVGGIYANLVFKQTTLKAAQKNLDIITKSNAKLISEQLKYNFKITEIIAAIFNNLKTKTPDRKLNDLLGLMRANKLPSELILFEYYSPPLNSDTKQGKAIHKFIYNNNKNYEFEKVEIFSKDLITPPSAEEITTQSVFSSPKQTKIYANKHYLYSISSSLNHKGIYTGYIRIFFAIDKIERIIQNAKKHDTYFTLISEDEHIISSTNKDFLIGKDIHLNPTIETQIYEAVKNKQETSKIKNKIISYTKVGSSSTAKRWLLIAYMSNSDVIRYIESRLRHLALWSILTFLAILIGTIIATWKFSKELSILIKKTKMFETGIIGKFPTQTRHKEINQIASTFNNIIKRMHEIEYTAKKITRNNFTANIKPRNEKDIIAIAINNINKKLQEKEIAEQEQLKKEEIFKMSQNWKAELYDIQRNINNDTEELSFEVIRALVKNTEALMGAMFVVRTNEQQEKHIKLAGAYAYEEKRTININFEMGEGIIGTCALEKNKIYISQVPDNYLNIGSGMGQSKPGFIAIFPAIRHNKVIGIMEIAFMKKPQEHVLDFLEDISKYIAFWLSITESKRMQKVFLDRHTNQTTEFMKKESDFKSVINAVNQIALTMQFSTEGNFMSANNKYYDKTGYKLKDLKDKQISEVIQTPKNQINDIIKLVLTGKNVKKYINLNTNNKSTIKLKANFAPYYNHHGHIEQIIIIGIQV